MQPSRITDAICGTRDAVVTVVRKKIVKPIHVLLALLAEVKAKRSKVSSASAEGRHRGRVFRTSSQ